MTQMMNDSQSFRLLSPSEIDAVCGGFVVADGAPPPGPCPVDDWWALDWLEDFGDVKDLPGDGLGFYQQYWTDGTNWCFYDEDDNLLGRYVEDPNGTLVFSLTTQDGQPTVNFSVAGTGGGGATNDSSGAGMEVTLRRVGG